MRVASTAATRDGAVITQGLDWKILACLGAHVYAIDKRREYSAPIRYQLACACEGLATEPLQGLRDERDRAPVVGEAVPF